MRLGSTPPPGSSPWRHLWSERGSCGPVGERKGLLPFIAGLLLVTAAQGWGAYARGLEEVAQQRCGKRTIDEAISNCRADPAHLRRGRSAHGNPILTIVRPGTTADAERCLWEWSYHQKVEPAWSIQVD